MNRQNYEQRPDTSDALLQRHGVTAAGIATALRVTAALYPDVVDSVQRTNQNVHDINPSPVNVHDINPSPVNERTPRFAHFIVDAAKL
jgi:hypothetical protein